MSLEILLVFVTISISFQLESNQKSEQIYNEPFNLYVKQNSEYIYNCGQQARPCSKLEYVFSHIKDGENLIHVYKGIYELPLSTFEIFIDDCMPNIFVYIFIHTFYHSEYPNAEVVAEEEVQINITSPIYSICKIRLAFSFIRVELGELYFTVDDDESSLKFSKCNLLRDDGNTAINAYSLAIINRGSLILENLDVDGGNQLGSQSLIQATSPKLIHFTSSYFTNLTLKSGSTAPLLLNVNEIHQNSHINISDIHVNKNTASSQANAGVIFIHASEDQTKYMKNEDPSTEPLFVLENSEIIQNTFSSVSDSCIIQIEGIKPQQILIKNCIISNRSPFDSQKTYEVKIALISGSISQKLISQFQTVDFGPTFSPVAVKLPPSSQFTTFALPLDDLYAKIQINKEGLETCSSYTGNYHLDVRTLSCAVIMIISQDRNGELKKSPHIISIKDSFIENDLRTDGVAVSFVGENSLQQSNKIIFEPILPFETSPSDNALFCVRDGGLVTLTNLYIQRSNQIGSENAPIALIISGAEKQSSGVGKNSPGQLVIDNCILEGGNSVSSDVWYNLGLAETCNVGYGAAIVADGQTIVQISGSTIKTFEGPAVRALNGANVQIDKNTILDNNGQRNRNKLSSMQTNVVCEGGIGTTTVEFALDNVTSFTLTGNAWLFSPSGSNCAISAKLNGIQQLPRSQPQTETANVTIYEQKKIAEVNIGGRFLEPCMCSLVLEIRQNNGIQQGITLDIGVENASSQVAWSSSNNVILQLEASLIQELLDYTPWEVSIYEVGQKDSATWVLTEPVIEGEPEPQEEKKDKSLVQLLIIIIVPSVAFIIGIIITILIAFICIRHFKKIKKTEVKTNNTEENEIQVFDEEYIGVYVSDDQPYNQQQDKHRQEVIDQQTSPFRNQCDIRKHPIERVNTNLSMVDQQILKGELNKKTQNQIQQSQDSIKSSKQMNGKTVRQKIKDDNQKGKQSKKIKNKHRRSKQRNSDSFSPTTSSDNSDSSSFSSFSESDKKQQKPQIENRGFPIMKKEIEQPQFSLRQNNSLNMPNFSKQHQDDQLNKKEQNHEEKQDLKTRKINKDRRLSDSHSSNSSHQTTSASNSHTKSPRSRKTHQTVSSIEDNISDSLTSSTASTTDGSFDEYESTESSSIVTQDIDEHKDMNVGAQLKSSRTSHQQSHLNSKHDKKSQKASKITNDKLDKSQEVDSVSDNFGSDSQSVMSTENGQFENQSQYYDLKNKQNIPNKHQQDKIKTSKIVKKHEDSLTSDLSYQEEEMSSDISDIIGAYSLDFEDKSHQKEEFQPIKNKTKRSKKSTKNQSDEIQKQDENKGEYNNQSSPQDTKQEKNNNKDIQRTDSIPPSVEGMQLFAFHNKAGEEVL